MIAQIHKDFTFLTAVHFEGKYMVNLYEMSSLMIVETENPKDQNTAIDRITYFLNNTVENCIFIYEKETKAIEKYQDAGLTICTLPEEPYDQIVGMILLNKLNAIMENKIVIEEIIFGSKLSNLIKFNINYEASSIEFNKNNWYNQGSLDINVKKSKGKVVPLIRNDGWAELNLTWQAK